MTVPMPSIGHTIAVSRPPGGTIGYVGLPHGVNFDSEKLFYGQRRMLGGRESTSVALRHAAELLAAAQKP